MPWYSLSESGLVVRDTTPTRTQSDLIMALANTLEQAAKLEQDPEVAAREAGIVLYEKGILSTPPFSLKELLDLAQLDDHLAMWLTTATVLPLSRTETPDPEPILWDLAVMA